MAKFDITKNVAEPDRLLAKLTNPRHRRIISLYRRHSIFEVSGEWERIVTPDMMAPDAVYHIAFGGVRGALDFEGIRNFYSMLTKERLNVIGIKSARVTVGDESMTTDSNYYHYMTGAQAIKQGGANIDPKGFYRAESHTVGVWYFDDRARLLGENGSVVGSVEYVQIPEEEFITPEETRVNLLPLVNELTPYEPGSERRV